LMMKSLLPTRGRRSRSLATPLRLFRATASGLHQVCLRSGLRNRSEGALVARHRRIIVAISDRVQLLREPPTQLSNLRQPAFSCSGILRTRRLQSRRFCKEVLS
jgi:hypothetical protein